LGGERVSCGEVLAGLFVFGALASVYARRFQVKQGMAGMQVDLGALERLAPEQQEQVREQLEQLERAFRENPLLGYSPHPKQALFHAPPFPPVRAFFGGNRSGKTHAAIIDTIIQVIDDELVPEHLKAYKRWRPPVKVRVVTPDLTNTLDGVIHEKLREWCPRAAYRGRSFDQAWDKVQRILRFANGSWVQFNSSEQEREKLGGVALHRVVYDEEPRQEVRNECAMRLVDYDGEEIFALTPFSGMAWMYDQLYEPWELLEHRGVPAPEIEARLGLRVTVVDMDDNPHLSEAGKRRQLQKYSGPEREARKSGRFVSFSGRIYPTEPEIVPEPDRVPPGAEVFRGIDPGWRHMLAVVYCYLDFDDNLVVFDELALRGSTVKEACDEMRRRDLRWGHRQGSGAVVPLAVNWSVIDPASRNKNAQTGRSDQQEFSDHGIYTLPGQNAVSAGINRVKERIDARKLQVAVNCRELQGQFKRYRWVKDSGRGEHEAREQPVKRDDHLLDALRYVCMQRPLAPERPQAPVDETREQRMLRAHMQRVAKLGKRRLLNSGYGPGQWS
jgi:phage terminase large subunit-like protein